MGPTGRGIIAAWSTENVKILLLIVVKTILKSAVPDRVSIL